VLREITFRNNEILNKYKEGLTMDELAELFCLSNESIRKIIYKNLKKENNKSKEGELNNGEKV